MSITFPTTLDTFTNPAATDTEDASAALYHDVQHSNVNDAVVALQAKVGIDSSAVTSSHDYKLAHLNATNIDNGTLPIARIGANVVTMAKLVRATDGQVIVGQTAADSIYKTLSGDATLAASGALTVANSAITYAKMQNVSATDMLLGRATAGAGVVEEIALTAAGRALIDDVDAAAQRNTLGLGTAAVQNVGAFCQASNNLSDVTAATARTNLGLGSIATQASNNVTITGGAISGASVASTTLSSSGVATLGTIGSSFTGNIIAGVQTAAAASSGQVGEVISSTLSTFTNYTTTATFQQVVTITLTPGDWEIAGYLSVSGNGATLTSTANFQGAISTTTASSAGTTEGLGDLGYLAQSGVNATSGKTSLSLLTRVNISASTAYYLNTRANFTAGNPQHVGSLFARRLR